MAAWGMIIGIMFVIILLMVMMGTRKRVAIQANFELLKWPQRPEGSEEPFSWRDADVKSSGDAYRTISANNDSVRVPGRREVVSKISSIRRNAPRLSSFVLPVILISTFLVTI